MSRIGKKAIIIPEGVSFGLKDGVICVSGPKGTLRFTPREEVAVKKGDGKIFVEAKQGKVARVLAGTTRQIIAQMIEGVTRGWSKTLEVVGIGYRVSFEGENLVFSLGFSHPVKIKPPEGITFSVGENKVTVWGVDKALVGQVASEIRQLRLPDAYKGKGIRYEGEKIRLKPGKATKIGAGVGGGKPS